MKPFAIAATLVATLTLAACGNAPDQPAETATPAAQTETIPEADPAPSETPAEAPAATPSVSIDVPAGTMVPGTEMTVEEAVENVQQQVNEMQLTDEQKQQAVADARTQAEQAARAAGLSDEQVKQAGDAAEQAAKTMFGIE